MQIIPHSSNNTRSSPEPSSLPLVIAGQVARTIIYLSNEECIVDGGGCFDALGTALVVDAARSMVRLGNDRVSFKVLNPNGGTLYEVT